MGIDTTKAHDHPSTNALDSIPDDLLSTPPAVIVLAGKTLTTLVDPPGPGEKIDLCIRLRVYDVGTAYGDNGEGEPSPYRKTKLVGCWRPGDPVPPDADDAEDEPLLPEDPSLFGDDGNPTDGEPERLGDIVDIHTGVDRPGFSDAGA